MFEGWPFGEYPREGLQRLGPHVVAYYGGGFPVSNSAIVRGSEATMVFDANMLRYARELRAAVDSEPDPPLGELVLSHVHEDHSFGAMHFAPPARVSAHEYTRDKLAAWTAESLDSADLADMYPGAREEAGELRIVVPDNVVEEPERLDLGGGVVADLFPEPEAHTRGDLWAFVEPDGVALCGDLWFADCEPYLGSGSVNGAMLAIGRLRESQANAYLPGHGPAGVLHPTPGEDPVERYCAWLLDQVATLESLEGEELAAVVRSRYEAQRERPGGVSFPFAIPGFLEESVKAAVRDVGRR